MIHYVKNDILASDSMEMYDVLVHGCNCMQVWESGIAKQIKVKFPEAYKRDLQTTKDRTKLGTYSAIWSATYEKFIVNAYTQYCYGTDRRHVNYAALACALCSIDNDFVSERKIGMPRIGAGLADGDWNIIRELVADAFINREVFIYYLKD